MPPRLPFSHEGLRPTYFQDLFIHHDHLTHESFPCLYSRNRLWRSLLHKRVHIVPRLYGKRFLFLPTLCQACIPLPPPLIKVQRNKRASPPQTRSQREHLISDKTIRPSARSGLSASTCNHYSCCHQCLVTAILDSWFSPEPAASWLSSGYTCHQSATVQDSIQT